MNNDIFVDLHIHSNVSDGTEEIERICEEAVAHKVGILSVTDHNKLAGTKKALQLQQQYGLKIIPGVEVDSTYQERRCHILGYGFDVNDVAFNQFLQQNATILLEVDYNTLQMILKDYPLNFEEYEQYSYDRKMGGWKLIHFLVAQGVVKELEDAIQLMKRYKQRARFPSPAQVVQAIHDAGGIAILAHPGETFRIEDGSKVDVEELLHELIEAGIDGVECYYPRHKSLFEDKLVAFCKERDLCITSGSDYHGDFFHGSKQKIGCEFKRLRDLNLKGLIDFAR